ncbi:MULTISPECIES: DUF503 domain-containing protein [Priestia]|uniref:Uncharacterized protein n=1 Tax=Priestia filamentosa TaxID=1402861 RepID=A0A1X7D7D6_9BACI|nr:MULTISPECIES: DUF503 family protein [Priestia]AKO93802.1 hypothetical protein BEH_17995 [Priestia filamentosa]MCY8231817.1 DUF503 family protein [Priestia endophytica]MDT3764039.1 DUF503 family protein [Priestia filamentosa]OXS71486.1 hypothetical protein B1B01_03985 [Priestia filamentosa]WCM14676.1 DUF503 family protein [Priestia filamentosa]
MIGYLTFEAIIYDAASLKEKRAVLQRIITRIKGKFNVSIAEIDHQDVWQRTSIGIVTISSAKNISERELYKLLEFVDSFPEIERTLTNIEWL